MDTTESVILDPNTGKGYQKPNKTQLAEHITRATLTGIRQASPGYSVATALTPERLSALLRNAIEGDAEDQLILAEEMEERDTHYAAQIRTRKLAVTGMKPTVEAGGDDEKDQRMAEAVRELIRAPQFSDCLFDLLDGLGKGFSVVELQWDTSSTWKPKAYKWADPRFFKFDQETGHELRHQDHTVEGGELEPYKYIIHKPKLKSGLPIRNGLARLAATMYMLKGYTLKDWWAFAELFGMPIRVGKYGPNATEDEITTLVNAIANIASDAGAAIPESMKLELIETGKATGGDSLYKVMADFADSQISKAVLGQTMTADNGSSRSQAEVHNEVRRDIQTDDARQLANTLNETLVRWFIDFNFGQQENYPRICLSIEDPEDLKDYADALATIVDRGVEVPMSHVQDKFGIAEPAEGAKMLHPLGQAPQQQNTNNQNNKPALNRSLSLALNSQQSEEDDLIEIRDTLLDEWQPVMEEVIDPIQKLLGESESYEEFQAGLVKMVESGELEAGQLISALARGTFIGRAMGDNKEGGESVTAKDGGNAGNAGAVVSG